MGKLAPWKEESLVSFQLQSVCAFSFAYIFIYIYICFPEFLLVFYSLFNCK